MLACRFLPGLWHFVITAFMGRYARQSRLSSRADDLELHRSKFAYSPITFLSEPIPRFQEPYGLRVSRSTWPVTIPADASIAIILRRLHPGVGETRR